MCVETHAVSYSVALFCQRRSDVPKGLISKTTSTTGDDDALVGVGDTTKTTNSASARLTRGTRVIPRGNILANRPQRAPRCGWQCPAAPRIFLARKTKLPSAPRHTFRERLITKGSQMHPRLGVAFASVFVAVLASLLGSRLVHQSPATHLTFAMVEETLTLRAEPLSVEAHLILGCSPLAGIYASIPETQAFDTVKTALALGFRDFDTAPHYGLGLSETRLGKAIAMHAKHIPVRLWSKVGRVMRPNAEVTELDEPFVERGNMPNHPGCIFPDAPTGVTPVLDYSGTGVLTSYEQSFARLGTAATANGIHGLRVHDAEDEARFASAVAAGGGVDALVTLRNEGKIKQVSLGMNDPKYVMKMITEKPNGTFDSVMSAGAWNLMDQDGLEVMLLCQKRGIKIHNAGIFASGLLVGGSYYKYAPASGKILERKERWAVLAAKYDVPLPAVALAFALAPAVVEKAAIGVKSPQEVEMNVEWLEIAKHVPAELWEEAKTLGLLGKDVPTPK